MTEVVETNPKASKFRVGDRFRTTKYNNIFSNDYHDNCSSKIFVIDSVIKANAGTYATKDLKEE